ncbi:MAG TPA: flagellar protein FlgN [Sporosarcina sp.]|nr:flagellar protein FlgN [Sporosarcina sp.]
MLQKIVISLQQLQKMHASLLSLAKEKQEVIERGEISALDQFMKEEQSHIAAIEQLERNRQQAVRQFFETLGIAIVQQPTLTEIIQYVEDDEAKQQLIQAKTRLLETLHELQLQNDLNQKLTYQSLQFLNLSLNMVQPEHSSINYSRDEVQGKNEVVKRTSFDSKA